MYIYHALAIALSILASCKTAGTGDNAVKDFFANSRRRAATADEHRALGEFMKNGQRSCTAFFLHNNAGKTYVGTARHCAGFTISDWCDGGGQIRASSSGAIGTCTKVVAAATSTDVAILELAMSPPHPVSDTVRLTSYTPTTGTRLKMLGYPADPYSTGGLMVSENCWLMTGPLPDPHPETNETNHKHNCSTYGGNSGGPILIEGSSDVIGLPNRYTKDDYDARDPFDLATASLLTVTKNIVDLDRAKLQAAGVTISDSQAGKGNPGHYLTVGLYKSSQIPGCNVYATPQYITGSGLRRLHLQYESAPGATCSGTDFLICNPSGSVCSNTTVTVDDIGTRSFRYSTGNGASATYSLP